MSEINLQLLHYIYFVLETDFIQVCTQLTFPVSAIAFTHPERKMKDLGFEPESSYKHVCTYAVLLSVAFEHMTNSFVRGICKKKMCLRR